MLLNTVYEVSDGKVALVKNNERGGYIKHKIEGENVLTKNPSMCS